MGEARRFRICQFLIAVIAVGVVALLGCGGSTTTVIQQAPATDTTTATEADTATEATAEGPILGDQCLAETVTTSLVEVSTKRGPLTCSEAQGVLRVYFDNLGKASGSGAGLEVGSWFCIFVPLGANSTKVAACEEKGSDGRKFDMYSAGWAERPANKNEACDIPPPEGAGVFGVKATNVDCKAAVIIAGQFESARSGTGEGSCSLDGENLRCRLPEGYECTSEQTGYESTEITCASGNQKAVLESGA